LVASTQGEEFPTGGKRRQRKVLRQEKMRLWETNGSLGEGSVTVRHSPFSFGDYNKNCAGPEIFIHGTSKVSVSAKGTYRRPEKSTPPPGYHITWISTLRPRFYSAVSVLSTHCAGDIRWTSSFWSFVPIWYSVAEVIFVIRPGDYAFVSPCGF